MYTKQIKHNSLDYMAALKLRTDILRRPLGKQLSFSDTAGEESQLHFGYYKHHHLLACVVIKSVRNAATAKLRQMAVDRHLQGQGIGKALIADIEEILKQTGYQTIELSARKTAQGFYERLGYIAVGGFYIEHGIEHITMQKNI